MTDSALTDSSAIGGSTTGVVVPLDGTPFGERAIPTAVAFATALGARMELVHVVSTETPRDASYLAKVAETIHGIEVTTRIEPEDPSPLARADHGGSDALVVCMSTHGHSGLSGAVLGGMADELLRQTDTPFLLVGPDVDAGAVPTFDRGHLVLCFDGSEHAQSMVTLAATSAHALGLDIRVVMVLHRHGEFLGDHDATRPKEAAAALVDQLRDHGIVAELDLLDGVEPAHAITRFARDLPAALIVTSTHGSTGLVRTLMGSTAMRIVHHAACPVLVRRPG